MKKVMAFVVLAVSLLVGCGSNPKASIPCYSDDQKIGYDWIIENPEITGGTPVEANFQTQLDKLGSELVKYINKEYEANWNYTSIPAYVSDVDNYLANIGSKISYKAMYQANGTIYFDRNFFEGMTLEDKQYKMIVAHELTHYLFHSNTGKNDTFHLTKEIDGKEYVLGRFLEEAFVDKIATDFMRTKYHMGENEMASGYSIQRGYINLAELAMPNIMTYFINFDIDGLHKAINEQANKYVICKKDAFEVWLKMLDLSYTNQNDAILSEASSIQISYFIATTPKAKAKEFSQRYPVRLGSMDVEFLRSVMN